MPSCLTNSKTSLYAFDCRGRKSEVVIGGTSDETFGVHVKCPLFPSVLIMMLSLGVGRLYMVFQLYPSRNLPGYTMVLRQESHAHTVIYQCVRSEVRCATKFPSGRVAVQPFVGEFSFRQARECLRSVFRKTIDMHVRLFVLSVFAVANS